MSNVSPLTSLSSSGKIFTIMNIVWSLSGMLTQGDAFVLFEISCGSERRTRSTPLPELATTFLTRVA